MKKNNAGFTLIEILIAMAILSIALTAIIKSSSENIKNTIYLQDKTTALWVGMEAINQVRAGALPLPAQSEGTEQETEMLGKNWPWIATQTSTPNANIKKVIVEVKDPVKNTVLAHLESYLYEPK